MQKSVFSLKLKFKNFGVIEYIIFWNILLGVLFGLVYLFSEDVGKQILLQIALHSDKNTLLKQPWGIFTYSFFHSGFLHLMFNMLMLYYVAQFFKTFFIDKQLLALYLSAGIFSGLFYLSYSFLFGSQTYIVGASGAIMAILFAVIAMAPKMQVYLLGIIRLPIWLIGVFVLLLDIAQMQNNIGGKVAHIGGVVFGFIYVFLLKRGVDILSWLYKWLPISSTENVWNAKQKNKKKKATYKKATNETEERINFILDKIRKSGYDSLSEEEKQFLFKQ